eukprot:GHVS01009183.1.p1 GENE.GHVS01009183.1~~GHVS01009183.1.p1  ORF type:complete len:272 (+),score=45.15 GHVS01009183.1:154-969(+)
MRKSSSLFVSVLSLSVLLVLVVLYNKSRKQHQHNPDRMNSSTTPRTLTAEFVSASSDVLNSITSEASLSSPFSTENTTLENAEEASLDNVDEKLQEFERQQRMVLCFDFTQRHYAKYREVYVSQARSSSKQLQMREDEAMRLMFHGSLVACYHNINEKDIDVYSKDAGFSTEDEKRILTRHKQTPLRFSAKQMKLLEKIVSTTQDGSTPGFLTISGRMGQLYALVVVLLVTSALVYSYHKLITMREGKGKRAAKMAAKKQAGAGAMAKHTR